MTACSPLDIGYRLPNAVQLYRKVGANILLVDYRGFGHSEGEPSEKGLKLDAEVREVAERTGRGKCWYLLTD